MDAMPACCGLSALGGNDADVATHLQHRELDLVEVVSATMSSRTKSKAVDTLVEASSTVSE